MTVDRRTILKTLALAPTLGFLGPALKATTLVPAAPSERSCILLHGLFFLEFDTQNRKLVVATPKHDAHWYYTRAHGSKNLDYLDDPYDLDVSDTGQYDQFPDTMLTFPRSVLGGNGTVLTKPGAQHRCRMILPYPESILSFRCGPASAFHKKPGTLKDKLSIGDPKTNQVGTITCLVYQPGSSGTFIRSIYAEHPIPPTCEQINDALKSAEGLCGSGFDLELVKCDSLLACTDRDDELQYGVTHDDEWGLNELQANHPCEHPQTTQAMRDLYHCADNTRPTKRLAGDVSSCPQFGIKG